MKNLNPNPPEVCDTVLTYQYVSDYATIAFTVPVHSSWSEEECDSASQSDLESYVTSPQDYYLDEVYEASGDLRA